MFCGMSTACFFPELYCEQAVTKLGESGVKNIEIFFSTLSEYKPQFIKELKKRVQEYGAAVYSVHPLSLQFEHQLFSSHERARKDALDIFEQVLFAGAELGAEVYVFHGPLNVRRSVKLEIDYDFVAGKILPLIELSMSYGIKLGWENVHWCWYYEPDFPTKLNRLLGSEKLFFTLDTKQAAQAGFDPCEYIKHAAGNLINVHLCDYKNVPEKGIVPCLPFHGEMDFKALSSALRSAGYDKAVMLEVYSSNYSGHDELFKTFDTMRHFFEHQA